MLSSNPICPVCNYAISAVYCDLPTPEQLANGVKPLDSLPAAWWNKMWNMINCSVNQARGAVGSFITELNNVLAGAGICPNCVCTDQLYQAIDRIRQTIGNATVAGAVKSSSTPGMVSIDNNGFMTANCVGNATQLATSARTLVGAVNELKTTYDTCFGSVSTALEGKAPTSHASSANTYGVGTASAYGHLRISGTYTSDLKDAGMAASQSALYNVYNYATQISAAAIGLGNIAGCPLGTASAGTVGTAARSDHVHPIPSCVTDKYRETRYIGIGYGGLSLTAAQVAEFAAFSTSLETGCTVIKDVSVDSVKQVLGLGSAAYCCASDFRPSSWTPSCVACATCATCATNATCAYTVMDYCDPTRPLQIAYSGATLACSRVSSLAAYSTNLESGKTIIKDVDRGTVLTWLGLGSAAYCDTTAFRPSSWTPSCVACATCATCATNATCTHNVIDYCDPTKPLQIAYNGPGLTCAQVTHLAAYSTNLESGKIIIKDVNRGTVQSWLGCVACAGTATCAVNASWADHADCAVNASWADHACTLCNRPTYSQTCSGICDLYFYSGCTMGDNYTTCCYTSCICGCNGYYYGNVCGTSTGAIAAGLCRCDACVYARVEVSGTGQSSVAQAEVYIVNSLDVPVIVTNPMWSGCGSRRCIFSPPECMGCVSSLAMGGALIQVDPHSEGTLTRCHVGTYMICVNNNYHGECCTCKHIPYRMLGYAN